MNMNMIINYYDINMIMVINYYDINMIMIIADYFIFLNYYLNSITLYESTFNQKFSTKNLNFKYNTEKR